MNAAEETKAPGIILEITVFTCGGLVMTYEIIGSRIVAPYIGTSTYIWTSLIGVILGALSLGYWLGGNMADRRPNVRVLASAIFASASLVSLTVLVKDVVLIGVSGMPIGLGLKAVLASLLLFAPASVALGFVIPYAAKLRVSSLATTGASVGRLYALSTIGSIAGTFAAGFFLIPFVGSIRTLYLIAATLFILSFLLAVFSLTRLHLSAITLFAFAVIGSEYSSHLLRTNAGVYEIDTEYSRVRVFETEHPRTGLKIRAMATDPFSIQSGILLDSDELALEYTKFYHLARHYQPNLEHSLMIGGAGYSFPKDYLRRYPDSRIDVVEIDPQMTAIAREFFELKDNDRLRIFHEDGRSFLRTAGSGQYDAVMMDAFGSLLNVPYHLTTIEAVGEIRRVLTDDGVVVFNLGSAISGPAGMFLRAEIATYASVFGEVRLYKVLPSTADGKLQNQVIVACKVKCITSSDSTDPIISDLLDNLYTADITLDMPILTDDLVPVESYNSIAHSQRH
ncbi:fused MFS/spermidine synthase [soil metagenome]